MPLLLQVCGRAEVWGDFIVPQPAAHLEGADNVDLEGVFHSPLGEKLPFFGPWCAGHHVACLSCMRGAKGCLIS